MQKMKDCLKRISRLRSMKKLSTILKKKDMKEQLNVMTKIMYEQIHEVDAQMLEINTRIVQERGEINKSMLVYDFMNICCYKIEELKNAMSEINRIIIKQ